MQFKKMFIPANSQHLANSTDALAQVYISAVQGLLLRRRPYLNVWPTVEKALLRSRLEVDPGLVPKSVLHELGAIELRFRESSENAQPFVLVIYDGGIAIAKSYKTGDGWGFGATNLKFGISVADSLKNVDYQQSDELRLAIGVMLMACDPDYIEPILLNRDKDKGLTGGSLQRAIERARRRGVIGFDLGKKVEMSPHYRRPHFAIRWTEKGRTTPRLVPVAGSTINKKLLGDIPTGYDDDDHPNENK